METQNVKDTVRQIFTEYLTANGHRKTPERYAILDTIYSIDGHFVLGRSAKLMLNDQSCIDKEDNGVVESCTAHPEILLVHHP